MGARGGKFYKITLNLVRIAAFKLCKLRMKAWLSIAIIRIKMRALGGKLSMVGVWSVYQSIACPSQPDRSQLKLFIELSILAKVESAKGTKGAKVWPMRLPWQHG